MGAMYEHLHSMQNAHVWMWRSRRKMARICKYVAHYLEAQTAVVSSLRAGHPEKRLGSDSGSRDL